MVLGADKESTVETEGSGDGDLSVSKGHLLSGALEFHEQQVLSGLSQAELVRCRYLDHISWCVDRELQCAESVISTVHSEYNCDKRKLQKLIYPKLDYIIL